MSIRSVRAGPSSQSSKLLTVLHGSSSAFIRREKERQKLAEAEAAAAAVRRQLTQLRLENERLQMEHALLQKLLVVRDAILSVVVQLDGQAPQQGPQPGLRLQQPAAMQSSGTLGPAAAGPSVAALLQDPAALQAASQQLAAALGELPSLEQMELMVAELGGDSRSASHASGSSGGGSGGASSSSAAGSQATDGPPAGAAAALIPPAGVTVGAAAASGVVVERTRLQEVAPLPCPEARKEVEVRLGGCVQLRKLVSWQRSLTGAVPNRLWLTCAPRPVAPNLVAPCPMCCAMHGPCAQHSLVPWLPFSLVPLGPIANQPPHLGRRPRGEPGGVLHLLLLTCPLSLPNQAMAGPVPRHVVADHVDGMLEHWQPVIAGSSTHPPMLHKLPMQTHAEHGPRGEHAGVLAAVAAAAAGAVPGGAGGCCGAGRCINALLASGAASSGGCCRSPR